MTPVDSRLSCWVNICYHEEKTLFFSTYFVQKFPFLSARKTPAKLSERLLPLLLKKCSSSLLMTRNPLSSITALNKLYLVFCLRGFLPFQIVKAFSFFYIQFLRCPYRKVLVHMRNPDLRPFCNVWIYRLFS